MLEYSVYQSADVDGVASVLSDAFSRREPIGIAVGMTAPEFDRFARVLSPKAAAERLTIVARDSATGEIVGVMLNEDSATPPPDGMDMLGPAFAPVFEFLHELEVEHRADGVHPRPGEWLHLFLLAVAEHAGGQGIAQGLVARSVENAARRGYKKGVVEATGPVSQHIFRKHGFADRVRRDYAEHPVFGPVAYAGGAILMDRAL
jgi:predicted N-acetyltransferase YhbS